MAILNGGFNRERDLVHDDVTSGLWGTSTTTIAFDQTDLQGPVAATQAALTLTKTDKTLAYQHTLGSVIGNGNTYYEFAVKLSGDLTYTRTLNAGVIKTSSAELFKQGLIYYDRK